MSTIQIRPAEDSDNDQIRELSKRCSQEGMISLVVNRTPGFNTLHRLLDPEAWHLVASVDEKIIGLIGIINFPAFVLGKTCKIGYMLDLRVDSAFRSGTAAYRLVKSAIERLHNSDIDFVVANFIKDNTRSLEFTKGRVKLPQAQYLGNNRILNLLPIYRMKPDKRFEIATLREEEIPEIVDLYQKYSRNFKIAPILTEERFRKYLHTIEGLSCQNFLVAKEKGKIRAVTATWDEHIYKTYQVLRLTPRIRMVNRCIRFFSYFMRLPHPISLNEPLRQLSLVMYAHDDCPEALKSLFRHVNNINLGSEYTLIVFYSQEKDPVYSLVKNFSGVSIYGEMHLFAKDTSVLEKLGTDPSTVLLDLSMTI